MVLGRLAWSVFPSLRSSDTLIIDSQILNIVSQNRLKLQPLKPTANDWLQELCGFPKNNFPAPLRRNGWSPVFLFDSTRQASVRPFYACWFRPSHPLRPWAPPDPVPISSPPRGCPRWQSWGFKGETQPGKTRWTYIQYIYICIYIHHDLGNLYPKNDPTLQFRCFCWVKLIWIYSAPSMPVAAMKVELSM